MKIETEAKKPVHREKPNGRTVAVSARRANGFTLIELLVVIASIGVLIGLLLPAVQ